MVLKLLVAVAAGKAWSEDPAPAKTVRRAFPRLPLFFLPKHSWLPGAKSPSPLGKAWQGTLCLILQRYKA